MVIRRISGTILSNHLQESYNIKLQNQKQKLDNYIKFDIMFLYSLITMDSITINSVILVYAVVIFY